MALKKVLYIQVHTEYLDFTVIVENAIFKENTQKFWFQYKYQPI